MFIPTANAEQAQYFNEMQRASASSETAARCLASFGDIDVSKVAMTIQTPTLVIHRRGDLVVPFKRGRALAAMIPDARFVAAGSTSGRCPGSVGAMWARTRSGFGTMWRRSQRSEVAAAVLPGRGPWHSSGARASAPTT